ncbi:hypothetical protein DIPPA_20405 [Diplonema papillatum]|nr:hypothetical protein DIPPA_20405 [Diplonema papillatum]
MTREPHRASSVLASFLVLACARRCAGGYSRWASPDRVSTGCVGVATSGTDVYVGHGTGVERFDCADPLDCQSVADPKFQMGSPRGIAFSSGYVYVANTAGIQLLEANLDSITPASSGRLRGLGDCAGIAAGGSHMFATCTDAKDPLACLHVVEKPLELVGATGYCLGGSPTTVFFEETTSTVYVGTDDGVQAFDALDPTNLVQGDVFCAGLDIQGFLRLPSLPLLVFALLYQGSALGSMALIYDPPSTIAFVAGLSSAAFCVIVPVLVVCEVRKSVPSLAFFKEDDRYTGFGWRMAIGNGEWVSTTPKVLWAYRFQSVLTMYIGDKAWFGSLRFGSSFALAALSAPVTEDYTSCGHVKLCSALVVLVELATMSWVWPYAKSRDALADVVTTISEAGGMLFMAAGYYAGEPQHWTHSTATVLLTAAMFTVGIRVLLDVATEAFVVFTRRRARLQELVFTGCRSGDGGVLRGLPSFNEPRGFGKGKATRVTLQLPDNSQGGGIELSPRGSMFSTEATALKLGASARQQSSSVISSSPSDFVFTPLGDDPMDPPLLVSPTLSRTSVLGDGRFSSSLWSPRRSSPSVHSPVTPVGRRSQRLASVRTNPLLVPLTSSPEFHVPGLDDRRQQRSSFLSPLAEGSPPAQPQVQRNTPSTAVLPLSASCRLVRKSQPMPPTTSATTPSEAQLPPRRGRASTVRTASTAAASSRMDLLGLSANGCDRGSPPTSYEHSRAAGLHTRACSLLTGRLERRSWKELKDRGTL